MDMDEDIYHATPQTKGKLKHRTVDEKKGSTRVDELVSLPICSERLGLMGKIDVYRGREGLLIERKWRLSQIYRGQLYQLWAEMWCMRDMGYEVKKIAFYEISTNRMIDVEMPTKEDETEFELFLIRFRNYNPEKDLIVNDNKCSHCIYNNLCDKTRVDNVYS